ncbi:hypothetical protein Aduo_005910 [Ancylostoma duodenale]
MIYKSSTNGVYPVLVYDIPGSERCYVFQRYKKTARRDSLIYRCSGCGHKNQKLTSVLVTDDIFHKDPCRLNHNCIPLDRYKNKAERVIYESCQEIKQDKKSRRTPTQRHYSATAKKILNMPWRTEEERQKVLEKFSRNSYEDRRRSFARASSAHRRKVGMENVLEDLHKLPWGEDFLQLQTRNMHIYYSKDNMRASEPLRRRDRLRRQKIDEAMDEFQREMGARNYITTVTIYNYCEEITCYFTKKKNDLTH